MMRTQVSANAEKPRQIDLNRDVANLTDAIEGFGAPEVEANFIDADEIAQRDFKTTYEDFRDAIEYLSDDFTAEAADFQLKIDMLKTEGEAMNPLPHNKLVELDGVIEEISQRILLIQAKISSQYEEIIQKLRRVAVPNTDKAVQEYREFPANRKISQEDKGLQGTRQHQQEGRGLQEGEDQGDSTAGSSTCTDNNNIS